MVTTFYPPYHFGGDGIFIHRLSNGLARRGHDVDVIHCKDAYFLLKNGTSEGSFPNLPNVKVYGLKSRAGFLSPLLTQQTGMPFFKRKVIKGMLEENMYDVVHYHNMSLIGFTALQYGNAIKLFTLHEHWLLCPMHVLWKFDREVCTRPSCLLCTLHGRRPPQLWRYTGLMRRAARSIDAFVGPSLFTMRMHKERGLRGAMIQLPLFHSEPDAGSDPDPPADNSKPYFLFVGRLERIKGVQTIIPTFRQLPDVDLVVAGSGTYERQLREMAGPAPNIRFVGRADVQQLHHLYRGAVATIVPSLCYETFGIIVAESFATSTPVIVRDHSSLREFIEQHGGGFTFSNDEELREAIDRLRNDRELNDRLGRDGRAAYEAEFAEPQFIRHYLEVVRQLLDTRGSGRPIAPDESESGEPRFAGRAILLDDA